MRALFHGRLAVLAALAIPALAGTVPSWRLARSDHFEVYTQASGERAAAILQHFEQLRLFFLQQGGWRTAGPLPVRVIVFASAEEYQPYRLRANADAYYVGSDDRNYIVMAGADPRGLGIAAHEYAHLILRASDFELPPWLKEGLAELYSTLRMDDRGVALGGLLPGRVQTLRGHTWMPLADLMAMSDASLQHQERAAIDLFYAESWALVEMLALSPGYSAGFEQLITGRGEGLTKIYGTPMEPIERDLHAWVVQGGKAAIELPPVHSEFIAPAITDVSPLASRLLLAQLLLAAGEFDRAEVLFSALRREVPDSADVSAALGMIALHRGDSEGARIAWKRAIDEGIADAKLCYQYAILADQAGLPPDDIRAALERAIALQPNFDDAHYQLALSEKNARHYEAALEHFRAVRVVPDARAFAYWLALADTFNELGRRDEARSAAQHAAEHATTAAERAHADEQAYVAQTDPDVQFAHDANGRLQLVTTRKPHEQSDWNPFIEPGDDMRRIQGELRAVDCGDVTTIRVEAAGQLIALAIPDLQHVQMRHAQPEFVCGPQPKTPVIVDYARKLGAAAEGIVRGMDFIPPSAP